MSSVYGSFTFLLLIMLVPCVAHAIAAYLFMLSSLIFNFASIATRTFVDDLRHGQVRGLQMCASSLRFNSVFGWRLLLNGAPSYQSASVNLFLLLLHLNVVVSCVFHCFLDHIWLRKLPSGGSRVLGKRSPFVFCWSSSNKMTKKNIFTYKKLKNVKDRERSIEKI